MRMTLHRTHPSLECKVHRCILASRAGAMDIQHPIDLELRLPVPTGSLKDFLVGLEQAGGNAIAECSSLVALVVVADANLGLGECFNPRAKVLSCCTNLITGRVTLRIRLESAHSMRVNYISDEYHPVHLEAFEGILTKF